MNKEERLGRKTFWLFGLSNSGAAFIFLIIFIGAFFGKNYISGDLAVWLNWIILGAGALFLCTLAIAFLLAWFVYLNYTYTLEDNALKIRHGIMDKEETAIPYRQIQSVDIRQDLIAQIFGFGYIVILSAGQDKKDEEGEGEIVFPAIDIALAKSLQEELLKRNNLQNVIVQNKS